jgi:hypothetical protein
LPQNSPYASFARPEPGAGCSKFTPITLSTDFSNAVKTLKNHRIADKGLAIESKFNLNQTVEPVVLGRLKKFYPVDSVIQLSKDRLHAVHFQTLWRQLFHKFLEITTKVYDFVSKSRDIIVFLPTSFRSVFYL